MTDVNRSWLMVLADLLDNGHETSPRGLKTLELLAYRSTVPMAQPLLTVPGRQLGTKFAPAEAAWILSGDNRLETIRPFAEVMTRFSDDGLTLAGAYGPPLVDQLGYVARCLARDQDTRQAVLTLWRPRPGDTKDCPCTVAVQWLIRNGELTCVDTMRSSDTWLGWTYDVFTFSMVSAYLALVLRDHHQVKVTLGELHLVAGSQHLYERDWTGARGCVDAWRRGSPETQPKPLELNDLDLDQFDGPQHLIDHLWATARRELLPKRSTLWLQELY